MKAGPNSRSSKAKLNHDCIAKMTSIEPADAQGKGSWYDSDGRLRRDGDDQPAEILPNGIKLWHRHGELHRDNDKPAVVWPNGHEFWYQHGKKHRDDDKPATIWSNGTKQWYQHGELHRGNDKPAVIRADGTRQWYQHGKEHRDNDKPAETRPDGTKYWYQHGEKHRDNDRPAIVWPNGAKRWYQHGKLHRDDDQPAITRSNGTKLWYQHGKLHRIGGPARNTEYHIDGNEVTKEFHDEVLGIYTRHCQHVPGYGWVPRRLTYILRDAILRHQHPRHMAESWAETARLQDHE